MEYNPFAAKTHRDPFPIYKWLRDECPVYYNKEYDLWVISRYEDVNKVLRDWEGFSNREGVDIDKTDTLLAPGNMNELDGPPHDAMRALIQHWFGPKSLRERFDGILRDEVKHLVSKLSVSETFDLTSGLAWQLPTLVLRSDVRPSRRGSTKTPLLYAAGICPGCRRFQPHQKKRSPLARTSVPIYWKRSRAVGGSHLMGARI